jgi:hypothetical protein
MVQVVDDFWTFNLPIDFHGTVERLVQAVPSDRLQGLGKVVLKDTSSLPTAIRKKDRGQGYITTGVYHRAEKGRAAAIDLYVDAIAHGWPVWLLRRSGFREVLMSRTLYHEIGHHIDRALSKDYDVREAAANRWRDTLMRSYISRRFWYLRPFQVPIKWLLMSLRRLLAARTGR